MYTGKENRKYPRIDLSVVVPYRVVGTLGDIELSKTVNVSSGGLLLTTDKKIAAGTHLVLEIKIADSKESLRFIGRVIESRRNDSRVAYDTRIEFFSLDESDRKLLDKLMTLNAPGADHPQPEQK